MDKRNTNNLKVQLQQKKARNSAMKQALVRNRIAFVKLNEILEKIDKIEDKESAVLLFN